MRRIIRFLSRKVISFFGLEPLNQIRHGVDKNLKAISNIMMQDFLMKNLWNNEKYLSSDRLPKYSKSVYANNGVDGIIEEIFKRIGTTNKFFVEFGVHGLKNNSTFLLTQGWNGLWLEGNALHVKKLKEKLNFLITGGALKIENAFITSENIEVLFNSYEVPDAFDLLSVDIDGNDYWVWKSIENYKPKLVVIEYNASFPPSHKWVQENNLSHHWDGTSYFGASLKSLELLGTEKGYVLVGCDFAGTNAFFVLKEFADKFEVPFTSEFHYESPKYFVDFLQGHNPGFGPYLII